MISYTSHWEFVIAMDASRVLTWQQIAPHVGKEFPRIFAAEIGNAHVRTELDTAGLVPPRCIITLDVTGQNAADDLAKSSVRLELTRVFIPRVFGSRAKLLTLAASSKRHFRMLAETAQLGITAIPLGRKPH